MINVSRAKNSCSCLYWMDDFKVFGFFHLFSVTKEVTMEDREWNVCRKLLPHTFDIYEVTLQEPLGARFLNMAVFETPNSTWEICVDPHNYQDCKVVAWRRCAELFKEKI